jgi:hypothetical protein
MAIQHKPSASELAAFSLVIAMLWSGPAVRSETAAQPWTVAYTVTFDATWSAATHPLDFPPNPHFSGLIGGSHNAAVSFWEAGQPASLGIQYMAEYGSQIPLADEVAAAIVAGNAGTVVSGGIVNPSPGSVSESFTLTQDFSRVTLVTMIAPSPDWFVGVSGLDLFAGGFWTPQITVDLLPYDAGTDSGPAYISPNQPTTPREPISLKADGPFTGGVPLGTFTFTLVDPPTTVPAVAPLQAWSFPNPFNPRTTIRYRMPTAGRLTVAVYDLRGGLVRVLWDRDVEPGDGSIAWEGSNQRGRAAAAGTYIVRLSALNHIAAHRITLVK